MEKPKDHGRGNNGGGKEGAGARERVKEDQRPPQEVGWARIKRGHVHGQNVVMYTDKTWSCTRMRREEHEWDAGTYTNGT